MRSNALLASNIFIYFIFKVYILIKSTYILMKHYIELMTNYNNAQVHHNQLNLKKIIRNRVEIMCIAIKINVQVT